MEKPEENALAAGAPVCNRPSVGTSKNGRLKTGAPDNPGLRKFIANKRKWADPLDAKDIERGFRGWHARGYIPHRDIPGVTQFVTFRLADAMPVSRRSEWQALLKIENNLERRLQLEAYLDKGIGECWFRLPQIAHIAISALLHFNGTQYALKSWVIMPNHLHVLVEIWQTPLSTLIHTWKRHIAREANKVLGRSGPFWEREYWDTWIRDEEHCNRARKYIETNPVKAKLVSTPECWKFSSACESERRFPTGPSSEQPKTGAPFTQRTSQP